MPRRPRAKAKPPRLIVVVRADVDYELLSGNKWMEGSQGLWYGEASGFGYSIACDAYRTGYLAPFVSERSVTRQPDGVEPGTFFDPTAPLPPAGGCRH